MKKVFLFAFLFLGIIALGFWVYSAFRMRESQPMNPVVSSVREQLLQSDTPVIFSHAIVDPATVSHITPLGELNGGYSEVQTLAGVMINFKQEAVAGNKEIPVVAPADMTLESYSFHKVPFPPGGQWTLIFSLSDHVTMRLDHISRASDMIQAVTTTMPKDSSAEDAPRRRLAIKAGEIVGYTYGTVPAHNWNIYVFQRKQTNSFINQSRYTFDHVGQRLTQAVCPFDFYPEDIRMPYLELMGYSKAGQSKTCGAVSHDVRGAAEGLWHFAKEASAGAKEDRKGIYATPLSIIGNSAGEVTIDHVMDQRVDIRTDNPTRKDPAAIRDKHCFGILGERGEKKGYVFVRIVSDDEMRLAASLLGTCPTEFPEHIAQPYYR